MINLFDILEAADGQLFGEPVAQLFTNFCYDAREARDGELYVAMKTEHGDGHHFMEEATQRGAKGIMCTNPPRFDTDGLTVIVMRSVEDALLRWTEIILQKYGTTVIGVTGSAGKSTAQQAIAQVLGQKFKVYTNSGSIDGRFGLPLALGKLSSEHQFAVLEFGTHQPGEMAEMVRLAHPLVGIITAVQRAHTDRMTSLDAIAQEKGDLVRGLPEEGLAVLNFDDPRVRPLAGDTNANVMTVGLDIAEPAFGADLLAYNILVDRDKTGFDLRHFQERYPGRWIPLLGAHQLYSALSALAVGLSYDIPLKDGLHALTQLAPLPGRMNPLDGPNGSLVIDDTVSANPEGMIAALDWLAAVKDERGRAIFVMGDLDGLGHQSTLAHIEVGQHAARTVDRLVTQGDLAAEAGRAAIERDMDRDNVALTFSAEDAARVTRDDLGPYDIVVVKGGESARMERVVRELLADPGDAIQLARRTGLYEPVHVDRPDRPTWVVIDVGAMAHNIRRMKAIVGDDVALMAVVKANAYGHGAVAASTTALNNGAIYLQVSSLNEALELREAGIDAPILIDGYVPTWAAREIVGHDLTVTFNDIEQTRAYDRAAAALGATIKGHVRVDTGLGMYGMLPEEITLFFRHMRNLKHVQVEGVCTEFSAAHLDPDYTRRQLAVFESVIEPLLAAGFRFKYIHAADSAASLHLPESRFNMVRSGIAMYGLSPAPLTPVPADFMSALTWKTHVTQVKRLPPGHYVGDSNAFRTQQTTIVAILPVGFADGFRREPQSWRHVLIRGEFAPVIGHVGVNQTAVDITQIGEMQPGEEVVLIGRQEFRSISVEDVASHLNTSVYEVISTVLARVPRVK